MCMNDTAVEESASSLVNVNGTGEACVREVDIEENRAPEIVSEVYNDVASKVSDAECSIEDNAKIFPACVVWCRAMGREEQGKSFHPHVL